MLSILVTGINGFVGKHLAHELFEQGHSVIGLSRQESAAEGLEKYLAKYISCDVTREDDVAKLDLTEVNAIINLAGLAAVGRSFDEPQKYLDVNVGVLTSFIHQIRLLGRKNLRLVAISSGAVYKAGQPLPLNEQSFIDPSSSPYAASKLAMEEAARDFRAEGYDCVIARPFNHIGPGQETGFLLPDLHEKLCNADDNRIYAGDLTTKRDYTDVRDVARAYIALATAETLTHDIYNVCSGKPVSGNDIFELLKAAMNKNDVEAIVDKNLFRPSDQPVLYGDNSRLRSATNWAPTIELSQTIQDFINS